MNLGVFPMLSLPELYLAQRSFSTLYFSVTFPCVGFMRLTMKVVLDQTELSSSP